MQMVRVEERYEPNEGNASLYDQLFNDVYVNIYHPLIGYIQEAARLTSTTTNSNHTEETLIRNGIRWAIHPFTIRAENPGKPAWPRHFGDGPLCRIGTPGWKLQLQIITCLYFNHLKIDPSQPLLPERDRFILSKGHAAPVLYAALARREFSR